MMVAIPGQPTAQAPAAMPADAPALALAAINRLIEVEGRRTFAGFLDPAFNARWIASDTRLVIGMDPRVLRSSRWIVSDWRWGILWRADDWYEVGWHPDQNYLAILQPSLSENHPRHLITWDSWRPN